MALQPIDLPLPALNATGAPLQPMQRDSEFLSQAALRQDPRACWLLDYSAVRDALQVSEKAELLQADWAEAVLAGTRILNASQMAAHLVGPHAGIDPMVGQPIASFWPPESRLVLAQLIVEVSNLPPGHVDHVRPIRSLIFDGAELNVWLNPDPSLPGTLYAVIEGSATDERSLLSILASEDRYRRLIHHLPTPLIQVDASIAGEHYRKLKSQGVEDLGAYLDDHPEVIDFANDVVQVTDINQAAISLLGGNSTADFKGPVGFLFTEAPDTARRIMIARYEGKRTHSEVTKLKTIDGRLLDVNVSVTYPAPPERLDVTLITLEDITDRLKTESQLRQVQADFARAARIATLGELATSIAHEVNQPLSAIVTNAETSLRWLAHEEPNLAKVDQLTRRVVENARHANDIVQRIRGAAAKHTPEMLPLDLNELVEEAELFVRHDIDFRAIHLSKTLHPHPLRVIADRVQLQQVIVNLLVNSIQAITHASEEKGRVELATGVEGDLAVLAVRDSGPGIPAEDLDRIFEGFFTTKEEGIGIGLAICQSILLAHNGNISVSNHLNGGAHFRVSLPLVE